MILQISTHTRKVHKHINPSLLKKGSWAKSATLQHLRRVQPAGAENDLLVCLDSDRRRTICRISCLDFHTLSSLIRIEEHLIDAISSQELEVLPAGNWIKVFIPCI